MRDGLLPLLLTAAAVLATSGVGKLRDREATVAALAELGIPGASMVTVATAVAELATATLLVVHPQVGAPAAAALYAVFALVVMAQLRAGVTRSCGCLGSADTPPSRAHVVLDLALAAGCAVGTAATPATLSTLEHPLAGVVLTAAAAATTWAIVAGLELLPRALTAYRRPAA